MVLVMESAATSRSLRRFLLVPEERQSRWGCRGGEHGEETAEQTPPFCQARGHRCGIPKGRWGRSSSTHSQPHRGQEAPAHWSLSLCPLYLGSSILSVPRFATTTQSRAGFQNKHSTEVFLSLVGAGLYSPQPPPPPPLLTSSPSRTSL